MLHSRTPIAKFRYDWDKKLFKVVFTNHPDTMFYVTNDAVRRCDGSVFEAACKYGIVA